MAQIEKRERATNRKTRRASIFRKSSSRVEILIFVFHFLFFSSCNFFYFPFRRTGIKDLSCTLEMRSMNI